MSVGSLGLTGPVAQVVATETNAAGIEAAVKLTECAKVEDEEKRQALEMALERARYEEKRARRQFDAGEPEKRLVVSQLGARWNDRSARRGEAETSNSTGEKTGTATR